VFKPAARLRGGLFVNFSLTCINERPRDLIARARFHALRILTIKLRG
jgi:hypothetical protein